MTRRYNRSSSRRKRRSVKKNLEQMEGVETLLGQLSVVRKSVSNSSSTKEKQIMMEAPEALRCSHIPAYLSHIFKAKKLLLAPPWSAAYALRPLKYILL
jgi:hypothetical protein